MLQAVCLHYTVTQKIQCVETDIDGNKCIIVDSPGFDDTNGDDTHHANNLCEHLNAWGGVNAFVLVQNGTNIRLKNSIQTMMKQFEDNFGADSFWNNLVIVLTYIESKSVIKKIANKEEELIEKLHEIFPQSKDYVIPILFIGFNDGYNWNKWRLEFIQYVKGEKCVCDKMKQPISILKQNKFQLDRKGVSLKKEIIEKVVDKTSVLNAIEQVKEEMRNATDFVLLDPNYKLFE